MRAYPGNGTGGMKSAVPMTLAHQIHGLIKPPTAGLALILE
jgi:hypothetical protein